ncbi:MAG: hypothetical protein LBR44_10490 [Clostridiales Family XIII bacterium]|jgi:formate C-acetyltransferase|nr:hypothetical protein [Clostridiales Family XIII bacterium]
MKERINRLRKLYMESPTRAIFLERTLLLEEAKRKYEHLDRGSLYAAAMAYVLDNMEAEIREDEYIVSTMKQTLLTEEQEEWYAELCADNNFKAVLLMGFDPLRISKSIGEQDDIYYPEWFCSYGHNVGDYPRVLKLGFSGLAAEARERMKDPALGGTQKTFLENCIVVCDAMTRFGLRYSEKARELAEGAQTEEERRRFRTIEETCKVSPGLPAQTFRQAVQSVWFFHMVQAALVGCRDYSFGRIDEYLYPYYKADLEAGRITREEALEIIEEWYIHESEFIGYAFDVKGMKRIPNYDCIQYIVLGGTDVDGREVCNDISFLAMEAWMDLENIKTPQIIVRWFRGMNQDLLDCAVHMNAAGKSTPSFFNEELIIKALVQYGVAEQDARIFAYYGCNNVVIPGLEDNLRESWHNGPKYLELALHAGVDPVTQKRIGPKTMAPGDMQGIEDVLGAFREQLAHALYLDRQDHSRCDQIWHAMKPFSYESLFGTDCIAKASSLDAEGSRYRHCNIEFMGIATLADSLYALNQVVFVEKRFTLPEFLEILAQDWAGHEELAMHIRNHYPKYGNDDDAVDIFAKRVGDMLVEEVGKLKPLYNGRKAYASFYSMMWHRHMGVDVGATPDGRHAYEPFSENLSGTYGLEKNGPIGALNSAAKLPLDWTPSGAHNVKFLPATVKGPEGEARLKACINAYMEKGGHQIMMTVADAEELKRAKEDPEAYQNLMVRVFGFSDYFISLWPDQQDEIIARDTMVL